MKKAIGENPRERRPAEIVVVSSHVSQGSVGNPVIAFALQRLGFPVWPVPTILLPRHPGHGPVEAIRIADDAFAAHLEALAALPALQNVAAVISGYLASPAQAEAVADFVKAARIVNPHVTYLCDPVIGDSGGLYVEEAIAVAIRNRLLPLADILTPNLFEAAWLAGPDAKDDAAALVAGLAAPLTVVTSWPALVADSIAALMAENGILTLAEHRRLDSPAKGTGDLFAAVFLATLLATGKPRTALSRACAAAADLVAASGPAADELAIVAAQGSVVAPRTRVTLRRFVSGGAGTKSAGRPPRRRRTPGPSRPPRQ